MYATALTVLETSGAVAVATVVQAENGPVRAALTICHLQIAGRASSRSPMRSTSLPSGRFRLGAAHPEPAHSVRWAKQRAVAPVASRMLCWARRHFIENDIPARRQWSIGAYRCGCRSHDRPATRSRRSSEAGAHARRTRKNVARAPYLSGSRESGRGRWVRRRT